VRTGSGHCKDRAEDGVRPAELLGPASRPGEVARRSTVGALEEVMPAANNKDSATGLDDPADVNSAGDPPHPGTSAPILGVLDDLEVPEDGDFGEVDHERERRRRYERGADDDQGQRSHGESPIRHRRRDQQIRY
jgi:hypothetical protein